MSTFFINSDCLLPFWPSNRSISLSFRSMDCLYKGMRLFVLSYFKFHFSTFLMKLLHSKTKLNSETCMCNSTLICRFSLWNAYHQIVKLSFLMRFAFKDGPLPHMFSFISHNISAGPLESSASGTNCQKVWLFGLAVSNFSLKNVKHLIILSDILQNFVGGKREQRS